MVNRFESIVLPFTITLVKQNIIKFVSQKTLELILDSVSNSKTTHLTDLYKWFLQKTLPWK